MTGRGEKNPSREIGIISDAGDERGRHLSRGYPVGSLAWLIR
jgi:hypothetical protein